MNLTETSRKSGSATHGSSTPVVTVEGLHVSFGDHHVLKGISLELNKGENLVVLGRSGCGKSVLIKCIIGLLKPSKGKISVLGGEITSMDLKQLDEYRKKIGFLFQRDALYDSMSVRENLEFPLHRIQKGLTEKSADSKIKNALVNVGLIDSIDKMPSALSGGMRKRISLARTLVIEPVIMLYDEPTTGLDPATTEEISLLINNIREKYNTSSIIITHDIRCARTVADRIIVLNDGKIHTEGTLNSIEKSDDPFVKSFFI